MRAFRRYLVVGCLVGHFMLSLGLSVALGRTSAAYVFPAKVTVSGVLLAQLCLVSIWAALGTGRCVPRLLAAYLGGVMICSVLLPAWIHWGSAPSVLFPLPGIEAALLMVWIAMPLVVTRTAGFRLFLFTDGPSPEGGVFQVSLRSMLAATIVAAVLLAVGGGTTILAADRLRRPCYAAEMSPAIAAVCLERLAEVGKRPRVRG